MGKDAEKNKANGNGKGTYMRINSEHYDRKTIKLETNLLFKKDVNKNDIFLLNIVRVIGKYMKFGLLKHQSVVNQDQFNLLIVNLCKILEYDSLNTKYSLFLEQNRSNNFIKNAIIFFNFIRKK